MLEESFYDVISLKNIDDFSVEEKKMLLMIAKLLIESGRLWTTFEEHELPVLVAGIAKHSALPDVQQKCITLIKLIISNDDFKNKLRANTPSSPDAISAQISAVSL